MTKNPKNGLLTLEEAVNWRQKLRAEGKKLVVTNGDKKRKLYNGMIPCSLYQFFKNDKK